MHRAALLLCSLAAACALPPRIDDRTTPTSAYETFRGALARGEHAREWECMSEALQGRLGMESRAQWDDARTVALTQGHLLVRGICRSKVKSEKKLPDGRVELQLSFPFGYKGTVVMRRQALVRGYLPGEREPAIEAILEEVRLEAAPNGVIVVIPGSELRWWGEELGRRFARFEAEELWFLDDFAAGDDTPESIADSVQKKEARP